MTSSRRALLSVSDKTGVQELGRGLVERGFQLVSTGGTARTLREAGLEVSEVADITGHPEIMGGRVKTLHPAVHGGILARRHVPGDLEALEEFGYRPIDLVAVNLYPFRETVAAGGVSMEEAMEQVDIGGPTMLRAAAKNHAHVWVVVDPGDYPRVLDALDGKENREEALRRELAGKVFRHVSAYDEAVADHLGAGKERASQEGDAGAQVLPRVLSRSWSRQESLRYGENPDQAAAFYRPEEAVPRGIAALVQHHGKALSYNNLLDLDGALLSLGPFAFASRPALCIVKHTTPCGLALGETVEEAFRTALRCDPVSAFGSVIAVNRSVDAMAARAMEELFIECLVAPALTSEALEILSRKKNLRILTYPSTGAPLGEVVSEEALDRFDRGPGRDAAARNAAGFLAMHGRQPEPLVVRGVYGGLLAQTPPVPPFFELEQPDWQVVTRRDPTDQERRDLAFVWGCAYGVKSNAIVLGRQEATVGIGAGQMSRVDASRLAVQKAEDAGLKVAGSAMASDAFFPFRDGIDAAAEAGVKAVIQPGGSVRDEEVIQAADEHDMTMIFTGRRLFRH